jgi:hypothetical protein
MSVGIVALPSALRATTLFSDNFSNDTDVFSYPDSSAAHLPGPTSSGIGSWQLINVASSPIQAGVITNTLPGGGTGGAAGNTHFMAITRSGGHSEANADFSSPAGINGTLSVQWDMYDVSPGNFIFELEDASTDTGNVGPYIECTDFNPPNSGDIEIATRTGPSGTYNDLGGAPNNAWIHMDLEVNLVAESYQFLVNGVSKGTFGYINPGTVGPFKALNIEGQSNAGETIYLDNVNVNYTPGPSQWVPNGLGDWNAAGNWASATVPNAVDAEADFFGAISANHSVYTDVPVTVGTVNFNNANTYLVTGTGSLTLQASTGNAQVIVQQGTQELDLPTTIASNTVFNVSSGANLIVANPLTINSGKSLSQTGAGTVTYQSIINVANAASIAFGNSTHAYQLNLASGSTASVGGTGTVLELDSLSNSGTIDLKNNALIINYGNGTDPIATIKAELASGYAGGAWNGVGINSSVAHTTSGSFGLGYADSADPGNPAGLASGTIEIVYTLLGDANLDGAVNGSDFAILATNFNKAVGGWDQGDFNYDGAANGADFASLAANFNKGTTIALADVAAFDSFAASNGLLTSVPEPASVGLLLSGTMGFLGFRTRRRVHRVR